MLVHADAAQAIGKIAVRQADLGVDLLTVVGQKFYAPKGVGALIVRQGISLEPLIYGAGHEGGRRAGTENVPYMVGLGRAAELAQERLQEYQERIRTLRDTLHRLVLERVPTAILNGHPVERLPNTLNLSFPGVNAATVLAAIRDQVACSTGSACHAGHAAPSQVLLAMGRDAALASAALRLSLGWATTAQEIQQAADVIGAASRAHPLIGRLWEIPRQETEERAHMTNTNLTIHMDTLREWLEQGRPVIILDVRPAEERAEWAIPGSIHVDAYYALKAGDPQALASIEVPGNVPVITICGAGKTSLIAAEQLQARGIPARSLKGGMQAWSLAWNVAEVTLPESAARVIQVRRTGKGCLSYLIGADGNAVVIDPSLDPEVYRDLARRHGWRITHVLETHLHADHLSRARALAEQSGAALLLPAGHRVAAQFTPLVDGDTLAVGAARLRVLQTPGHTPESSCYLLDGAALFTGDTLFLVAVGRPDLHASQAGARDKALSLYRSLQRLLQLDLSILVLPGHTSEPIAFNGEPVAASLDKVRASLSLLREGEATFVDTILARIPPTPPNHEQIIALNEAGKLPEGDPTALEAGANRCAVA